jgi:hypothetical protein
MAAIRAHEKIIPSSEFDLGQEIQREDAARSDVADMNLTA